MEAPERPQGSIERRRPKPCHASLGTILYGSDGRSSSWDDAFRLYRWERYPGTLIFDTADWETQAALFKRLAFFVEKRGFAGTLLSQAELVGRYGWNAHNYHPGDLARFFTRAQDEEVDLTGLEMELRQLLLQEGLIAEAGGKYTAGSGGVLSVSRASSPALRELLLVHEALHGIFYAVPAFRHAVEREWDGLSEAERTFWRFLLGVMGYNPEDAYLMQNEFQAYLLQQEPQAVHGYFRTRLIPRLKRWYPEREDYIDRFLAAYPATFKESAHRLSKRLFDHTGRAAGRLVACDPTQME
jgi:hypothetical protein